MLSQIAKMLDSRWTTTLHSECKTAMWGNNKQNTFWAEGAFKEKTRNIILIFNIVWRTAIIWLLGKELNSY